MVTKKMLSDQILNKDRTAEFLYCPNCGAEYSANSGDYFMASDDYIFKCECGTEMELATKETTINLITN